MRHFANQKLYYYNDKIQEKEIKTHIGCVQQLQIEI
jgi:hypothetical protein